MSITALDDAHAAARPTAPAAWAMIAGALLQITLGSPLLASQQDPSSSIFGLISALNAVSHLLLLAGVVGLARSGVAGRGRLAVAGLAVTLVGLVMLTVAEGVSLVAIDLAIPLFGLATLALGLGPILAGVAILRAGHWTGWRRYTLLACGLYIPLALLPAMAMPGLAMNYAIGLWGVCWLLLGLALRAEGK